MDILSIDKIKSAMQSGFRPGEQAHRLMMSYNRAIAKDARLFDPPPKESAVMFLIYLKNNQPHTLFMERPENQGVHSGQISFPGGKREANETLLETACRETCEEIGIDPSSFDLIGELSELYIPPSHFIVQPFIGFTERLPPLFPNPAEVKTVIEYPLHELLSQNHLQRKKVFISRVNVELEVPYFDIYGKTLWGATAMMLAEFKMILENHS